MSADNEERSEEERLIAELGAYLDGEADAELSAAIERRLFSEAGARDTFRDLRDDTAAIRRLLDQIGLHPVPRRLEASVDAAFAEYSAPPSGRWFDAGPWVRMAAAAAIAAVAFLGGNWWADQRLDTVLDRLAAASEADRAAMATAVREALETRTSGETIMWTGNAAFSGQVTPIATYRSQSGHWCREYLKQYRFDGRSIEIKGIACRTEGGDWVPVQAEPVAGGTAL